MAIKLFNKNKRAMKKLDRLMKEMATPDIYFEYLKERQKA